MLWGPILRILVALNGHEIRAFPVAQIDQRSQNPRRLFNPALDEKGEFSIRAKEMQSKRVLAGG